MMKDGHYRWWEEDSGSQVGAEVGETALIGATLGGNTLFMCWIFNKNVLHDFKITNCISFIPQSWTRSALCPSFRNWICLKTNGTDQLLLFLQLSAFLFTGVGWLFIFPYANISPSLLFVKNTKGINGALRFKRMSDVDLRSKSCAASSAGRVFPLRIVWIGILHDPLVWSGWPPFLVTNLSTLRAILSAMQQISQLFFSLNCIYSEYFSELIANEEPQRRMAL